MHSGMYHVVAHAQAADTASLRYRLCMFYLTWMNCHKSVIGRLASADQRACVRSMQTTT